MSVRVTLAAVLTAVSVAALMTSSGPDPASAEPVDDGVQGLARFFEVVVFDAEFRHPRHREVISRWESPVSIALKGREARTYRPMVERHGRSLSRLTGLKIGILDPGQHGANITVRFVRRHEMDTVGIDRVDPSLVRRLAATGGCFFVSFRDRNGRIHRSDIVVNVERSRLAIDHCLLEELTQSLGLPNDSNLVRPSIFSDHDRLVELPVADEILIRTLYSPQLATGAGRHQVMDIVRAVIGELTRPLRWLGRQVTRETGAAAK